MKYWFSRLRRAALVCFACLVPPAFADELPAGVCELYWPAPMTNEDGSLLTDLVGYYIYAGKTPDTLTPSLFASTWMQYIVLPCPQGGNRYFAVSAVNVDGIESILTPVVSDTR